MANLYEKASLVLPTSPAYKDGAIQAYKPLTSQGTFDFSRGSNLAATRVDVNGLIEKGRENHILYSNTFSNSSWGTTDLSVTSGATDPNGGSTAWTIANTAANGIIQKAVSLSGLRSVSIYAKQGTHRYLRMGAYGGTSSYANFDLQEGVVSSGTKAVMESVGGGWYRCTAWGADGTTGGVQIFPSNNATSAPTTNGSILIWRAQMESGLVATDYIETGASTAQAGILEDMPRLDYSGGASCPSLLLEPQRTNLIPFSEFFDPWNTDSGEVKTANTIQSPEGLVNGNTLRQNNGASQLNVYKVTNVTSGVDYTFSVWLKKKTTNQIQIYQYSIDAPVGFVSRATIDFDAGTITNVEGSGATIEPYDNGWFRCSIKCTMPSTRLSSGIYTATAGQADVYVYGAQVEQGSYPTSYIPTYGSSVTRSADAAQITSATNQIGQSEGTLFIELGNMNTNADDDVWIELSDGTTNNRILIYADATGDIRNQIKASGSISSLINTNVTLASNQKIAITYAANEAKVFINGVQYGGTDTSVVVPATSQINLSNFTNIIAQSRTLKQALVFKTRLSNEELAALTTI